MKALLTLIVATLFTASLWACGCSNSTMNDTQTPGTTLLPNILPTIEENIPDPDVDTQMPIYTEGMDETTPTNTIRPSQNDKDTTK